MTVKVNGMTLSEIEAKFKEFDAQKKEARRKYIESEMLITPEPTFTPDAEYDFVHKIEKPLKKVNEELESRFIKAKTDEKRAELLKMHNRIIDLQTRCEDIEEEINPLFPRY